jgi:putative DNA primase/helicase
MIDPLPDLRPHIEKIARRILGEPNRELSKKQQLRFGQNGSLSLEIKGNKRGQWYDHEAKHGGGPWELLTRKGGMANGAAIKWLQSELGIEIENASTGARKPVATYDYRDERSNLVSQVCRFEPKTFRQRQPDGKGGWIWSTKGLQRVPYRLPELIAAPADCTVFIVEGEKDVDRLTSIGLVATCNPGGAGKWRPAFNKFFKGREVAVLPDNDDAGRNHARSVAANLAPLVTSVRILELPGLPPKGDVSDWLAAGGDTEELQRLAVKAPAFAPKDREETARSDCVIPTEFSDDQLALDFAEKHAAALLYVASRQVVHLDRLALAC